MASKEMKGLGGLDTLPTLTYTKTIRHSSYSLGGCYRAEDRSDIHYSQPINQSWQPFASNKPHAIAQPFDVCKTDSEWPTQMYRYDVTMVMDGGLIKEMIN